MSYGNISRRGRYSYFQDTSWWYTPSASIAAGLAWGHIPALDNPLPKKEQLLDNAQESSGDGLGSPDYPTVKQGSMSFNTRIHTGTHAFDGAGSDPDPTSHFMSALLESYFGTSAHLVAGDTINAVTPGTSSQPKLTSGANVSVGDCMAFYMTTTVEFRFVTAKSGSTPATLTLDEPLSATPTSGNAVYAAFNYSPTLAPSSDPYSVTSRPLWLNAEMSGENIAIGPGDITSFKIQSMAARDGARYAFDFAGDQYQSGVTPSAFTEVSSTFTGPTVVAKGSPVYIDGNGTEVNTLDLMVDFGIKHEWRPKTGAPNGRDGHDRVSCDPVVDLTCFHSSGVFWDRYASRSGLPIRILINPVNSNTIADARTAIAIWMPNAQVVTEGGSANGDRVTKVKLLGRRPTAAQRTAGVTNAIYYSVFGGV